MATPSWPRPIDICGASLSETDDEPPPPPPPEDPPLLLLPELLDPPPELLELGAAIGAARPAAAAPHEVPPPPPPEPPPAKPVHPPDAEPPSPELNEPDDVLLPLERVVDCLLARSADQSSICLPSPNARTHGNHSSRSAGRSFASSAMKNSRPDASILRNVSAARCCVDLSAPAPAKSTDKATITTPTTKSSETRDGAAVSPAPQVQRGQRQSPGRLGAGSIAPLADATECWRESADPPAERRG